MTGLDSLDQFFQPLSERRKPRRLSKKQKRIAIRQYQQRRQGYRQEQGIGLSEMVKSKEFKERVELLKTGGKLTVKGSKIAYAKGRIAAIKLAARIKRARSRNIYD